MLRKGYEFCVEYTMYVNTLTCYFATVAIGRIGNLHVVSLCYYYYSSYYLQVVAEYLPCRLSYYPTLLFLVSSLLS